MSKPNRVLISFLGTGKLEKGTSMRQYEKTWYRFDDGKRYQSSFFASALNQHFNFDKIILVGTVHSMWEEVYSTFVREGERDDDYYVELGEFCAHTTAASPLELPGKKKLESAIGPDSRVVLTYYGVSEAENEKNQQIILEIEDCICKGDELYVDITHAFRSLSLLLLNSLIYLQMVSMKGISIRHIFYGMFTEKGKDAPVILLDSLLKTTEWIMGAYAFKAFGNAYKISDLLADTDPNTGKRLKHFSDLMNLNHLSGIKHQTDLHSMRNKTDYTSKTAEVLIRPIVNEFSNQFDQRLETYLFQYRLAVWHRNHQNYSSSFLTLQESIISYICYLNKWDCEDKTNRDCVKTVLQGQKIHRSEFYSEALQACDALKKSYAGISLIRNSIAHSIRIGKSADNMIRSLDEYLSYFRSVMS